MFQIYEVFSQNLNLCYNLKNLGILNLSFFFQLLVNFLNLLNKYKLLFLQLPTISWFFFYFPKNNGNSSTKSLALTNKN